MAIEIVGSDVPCAYEDMLWQLKIHGKKEDSRNGPVISIPSPVELSILDPQRRVLFDPVRDANPFFHVMEFVWMMSGKKHLGWIKQFNSGFAKYSDDDKTLPASYGYRWRTHFGIDQIINVVDHLRNDPTSRRAVVAMWDPREDQSTDPLAGNDRPCNTHLYFRVVDGKLNMTVTNRSNDAIWGMLGANVVHMTFLHELVAFAIGQKLGTYRAYTNNLHIYTEMPRFEEIWNHAPDHKYDAEPIPLLLEGETYEQFLLDCEWMVKGAEFYYTNWFKKVAWPIYNAYLKKEERMRWIDRMPLCDWKIACHEWAWRRVNA